MVRPCTAAPSGESQRHFGCSNPSLYAGGSFRQAAPGDVFEQVNVVVAVHAQQPVDNSGRVIMVNALVRADTARLTGGPEPLDQLFPERPRLADRSAVAWPRPIARPTGTGTATQCPRGWRRHQPAQNRTRNVAEVFVINASRRRKQGGRYRLTAACQVTLLGRSPVAMYCSAVLRAAS